MKKILVTKKHIFLFITLLCVIDLILFFFKLHNGYHFYVFFFSGLGETIIYFLKREKVYRWFLLFTTIYGIFLVVVIFIF